MIFKKNLHCLRNMLNRLQAKYSQIRNNVIYNNLLTLDILCKKEKKSTKFQLLCTQQRNDPLRNHVRIIKKVSLNS